MALKALKMEKEKHSTDEVEKDKNSSSESQTNELTELRRLLIQPAEVSEVLPKAVAQSNQKNNQLANATLPIVEENIRQSVKQNPEILAEALFPAIGPAIRKAIAEALSQMVQSLNQTLENSVSPKGLRWRLEAWQTGKPFAEVVMLNSLLYRVEEVFLIHRETGGLLQHASASNKDASEDADMVSAMLTAIQDFAHDSFKDAENATLDSLQLNELSVWLERSPDAILAAVIRGNPPLNLREIFKEAIEAIQFVQKDDFENFDGDTSKFEKSRPMLDNCLQFQLSQEATSKSKLFNFTNVLAGLLGLFLLIFGFFYARDSWRWSNYLTRLKTESGVVVTETNRGWRTNSVSGLRDPLAINPEDILSEYNLDKDSIESNWKPYLDLSPKIILSRANKTLNPPPDVKLDFADGVLTASGNVTNNWFIEAKRLSTNLAGVTNFQLSIDALQSKIQSQSIKFNCGTADYADSQSAKIVEVTKDLETLANSGKSWFLEVQGQADSSGNEQSNAQISQLRADKVTTELLKSDKLKPFASSIKAIGVSVKEASDCKVDFEVKIKEQ